LWLLTLYHIWSLFSFFICHPSIVSQQFENLLQMKKRIITGFAATLSFL